MIFRQKMETEARCLTSRRIPGSVRPIVSLFRTLEGSAVKQKQAECVQGKPVLICILARLLGFSAITLELTKIASYKIKPT